MKDVAQKVLLTFIFGAHAPNLKELDMQAKLEANEILSNAAFYAEPDKVIFALKAGANVNTVTYRGDTPLHLAIPEGNQEIVSMLLESGANTSLKNKIGFTPADQARYYKKDDLLFLIENYPLIKQQALEDPTEDLLLKSIQLGLPIITNFLLKSKQLKLPKEHLEQYLELAQINYEKTKNRAYQKIERLIKHKMGKPLPLVSSTIKERFSYM